MDINTAYRIVDAFEAWHNGSISHEAKDSRQTARDVDRIRERYNEVKHKMGFAEAKQLAQAEFVIRLVEAPSLVAGYRGVQVFNWLIYIAFWHLEIRREWAGLWEIDLGFIHLRQFP